LQIKRSLDNFKLTDQLSTINIEFQFLVGTVRNVVDFGTTHRQDPG